MRLVEPTSGQIRLRRRGHHASLQGRSATAPAGDADRVPGSVRFAQSTHDRWRHRRRADRRTRARPPARRWRRASRIYSSRWDYGPTRCAIFRISFPAASVSASTRRARTGAEAEPDRLRRAGLCARRLDPGPENQSPDRPAARTRLLLPFHRARPRRGRAYQPPCRGDVSRPHRRNCRQGRAVPGTRGIRTRRHCWPQCRWPTPPTKKLAPLVDGDVPSPVNPPSGCTFHTRCRFAMDRCKTRRPALLDAGAGHQVACLLNDGTGAITVAWRMGSRSKPPSFAFFDRSEVTQRELRFVSPQELTTPRLRSAEITGQAASAAARCLSEWPETM